MKKAKKPPLGSGKRFSEGEKKIEKEGLSKKSAGAIMAKAGIEKYGAKKMAAMAEKVKARKK